MARFQRAFPDVQVDGRRVAWALEAFDSRRTDPVTRLTSLAGALLLEPPVDDLFVPFAHEVLSAALRRLGVDVEGADRQAGTIVEGVLGLGERPLLGLQVSIGAPRRGVPVTLLSHLDQVIESIHARLSEVLAHPVGPQEHADGRSRAEMMPSDQWEGHVTDSCQPAHRHDALLVLPGRSIGVGESIAIAATLMVPVFAVQMPVPAEGDRPATAATESSMSASSCRVRDSDVIQQIRTQGTAPADVAGDVVAELEIAAPHIRQQQRTRMRHLLDLASTGPTSRAGVS